MRLFCPAFAFVLSGFCVCFTLTFALAFALVIPLFLRLFCPAFASVSRKFVKKKHIKKKIIFGGPRRGGLLVGVVCVSRRYKIYRADSVEALVRDCSRYVATSGLPLAHIALATHLDLSLHSFACRYAVRREAQAIEHQKKKTLYKVNNLDLALVEWFPNQ